MPIMMNFKYYLLSAYLILISSLQSCMATEKSESDITLNHSICTNTHLGYQYYDYNYRKEMCKSIGEMNIGMIRDYVYNNATNSSTERLSVFNNVLYNLRKYAPHTQVLGILHDRRWELDKDVPLSKFHDLVRSAVNTYNGKTKFVPTDYGKEMSFEIQYWEICNELDWDSYGKAPFESVDKAYNLIKSTYKIIKETNPNAKVVFPGVAHIDSRFMEDIFEYTDDEGKRIWDYFDVFNFHHYPSSAEDLIPAFKKIDGFKKKYGWSKPVWLTEVGWTEFHLNESDVAMNLPKAYLIAFAYGIERVFMFQHRRFDFNCSSDASYGVIRSSLDATYISLSSGENSFSKGTGHQHILINTKELYVPLIYQRNKKMAEFLLERLKKYGLAIKGNDYIIEKVLISHVAENGTHKKIIFDKETGNEIVLPAIVFKDCNIHDTIIISFKDYKKDPKWKRTDKTKSYYALKELIKRLPDGASSFSLEKMNDLYKCKWLVKDKSPQMAMWSMHENFVTIDSKKMIEATDYMGNRMTMSTDGSYVGKRIIYFNGQY